MISAPPPPRLAAATCLPSSLSLSSASKRAFSCTPSRVVSGAKASLTHQPIPPHRSGPNSVHPANPLRLSTKETSCGPIMARSANPPIMPAIMTPGGPLDLSSVLFRNRIIFVGQPINSEVAQRVISQLLTLAAIDEHSDILMYINCPGESAYSVLAVYDCMSWIKPKVGTVCFGVAASQGALLLAGGEKGMR